MNRKIFQIASAYMSVIIGGGFASGQEVCSFSPTLAGWVSLARSSSGVLFAFLGMQIAHIGTQLKVDSHKEVLQVIFGKQLSLLVDLALIFFLFGVGVAMLAGSGSLFQEHLGLPSVVGSVAMTVVIAATLCLNLHRIVDLISAVTPFLIVMVVIVVSYALFNNSGADYRRPGSRRRAGRESRWPLGLEWLVVRLVQYCGGLSAAGRARWQRH